MADEYKICFIICANDELQLQECMMYLSLLHVPEGYQTDLITIEGAVSMAAGYNEGMRASDARYKVYLHQDTFIVEPFFLDRLIKMFKADKKIGMVGIVGAEKLSSDGVMWHEKRCGYVYRLEEFIEGGADDIELLNHENREVEAIDGFLMATQYDIPWREDIFRGWDFYDVSQCMEFRRAGYKVVVPAQRENWVIHSSGATSFWHYNENRELLLKEYPEIAERRRARKRILFLNSNRIFLIGIPSALMKLGHNVEIPAYNVELEDSDGRDREIVGELLEEGHYDLVVTYNFSPGTSDACQDFGIPYYAWTYDSPLAALYTKAALNEVNHISVFDRKQYERLSDLGLKHLYYLPLAPEADIFGAVHIDKEDEEKYGDDVTFVGRLYNNRVFEEIFDAEGEVYREEVEEIVAGLNCTWDENTTLFGRASQELISYMISKQPEITWSSCNIDKGFFCESIKLARKCNEVERIKILCRIQEKYGVVLYADDSAKQRLKDMTVKPWLNYIDEMPKVFHLSKINLNITSRSIESGIPQRVWDILAVGGFCLTNYQPELEEYFEIGKDLEVWHDLPELEEKIQYYLEHEEERIRIAINGYQKVRKNHTLQMRLEEILHIIFGEEN